MSRHTLSDGVTPHPGIRVEFYDEWLAELAPRPNLVGDYYKRGLDWRRFEEGYIEYLRSRVSDAVKTLANRALVQNITLLCIEETPEKCHRRLLAEECVKHEPTLETKIK